MSKGKDMAGNQKSRQEPRGLLPHTLASLPQRAAQTGPAQGNEHLAFGASVV